MLAIGFLLLDAVLLGVVAVWDDRPALLAWSAVFAAMAVGVLIMRRRHLRSLEEITRARELLRRELRAVQPERPSEEP